MCTFALRATQDPETAGARSPADFILRSNTQRDLVRPRWDAMRAPVPSQMTSGGEPGAALAYVRLVPRVATHVRFERAGVAEG